MLPHIPVLTSMPLMQALPLLKDNRNSFPKPLMPVMLKMLLNFWNNSLRKLKPNNPSLKSVRKSKEMLNKLNNCSPTELSKKLSMPSTEFLMTLLTLMVLIRMTLLMQPLNKVKEMESDLMKVWIFLRLLNHQLRLKNKKKLIKSKHFMNKLKKLSKLKIDLQLKKHLKLFTLSFKNNTNFWISKLP